jgi:hypothetical protein
MRSTLRTQDAFGNITALIRLYGAFSVAVLVGVGILAITGREVTSFMWGRAGGMFASAAAAYWLAGLAARGSRPAYLRVCIISIVVPIAVIVIDTVGAAALPSWFVALQIAGALALAPSAYFANRPELRAAFPKSR